MINWYEKIPKGMLLQSENPNKKLHGMNVPFRACVVAPSGSGKTSWLLSLIHLFSQGKGTFADITIITRNKDEPLYTFLQSKCESIVIKEGLENLPRLDKFNKNENHLVCLDDLVLEKDLTAVSNYYVRCRKLIVSICFLSQSFYKIPKIIRSNCNYLIILKMSGQREINMIMSEFGLGVSKDKLLEIYQYATAEKFSPLMVDLEADPDQRFRKGFLEIIPIE
jgi:GTPase SAR1 family protein